MKNTSGKDRTKPSERSDDRANKSTEESGTDLLDDYFKFTSKEGRYPNESNKISVANIFIENYPNFSFGSLDKGSTDAAGTDDPVKSGKTKYYFVDFKMKGQDISIDSISLYNTKKYMNTIGFKDDDLKPLRESKSKTYKTTDQEKIAIHEKLLKQMVNYMNLLKPEKLEKFVSEYKKKTRTKSSGEMVGGNRNTDKDRDRNADRNADRNVGRDRDVDRDRDRNGDKDNVGDRNTDRDNDRDRNVGRNRNVDRDRNGDKDTYKERENTGDGDRRRDNKRDETKSQEIDEEITGEYKILAKNLNKNYREPECDFTEAFNHLYDEDISSMAEFAFYHKGVPCRISEVIDGDTVNLLVRHNINDFKKSRIEKGRKNNKVEYEVCRTSDDATGSLSLIHRSRLVPFDAVESYTVPGAALSIAFKRLADSISENRVPCFAFFEGEDPHGRELCNLLINAKEIWPIYEKMNLKCKDKQGKYSPIVCFYQGKTTSHLSDPFSKEANPKSPKEKQALKERDDVMKLSEILFNALEDAFFSNDNPEDIGEKANREIAEFFDKKDDREQGRRRRDNVEPKKDAQEDDVEPKKDTQRRRGDAQEDDVEPKKKTERRREDDVEPKKKTERRRGDVQEDNGGSKTRKGGDVQDDDVEPKKETQDNGRLRTRSGRSETQDNQEGNGRGKDSTSRRDNQEDSNRDTKQEVSSEKMSPKNENRESFRRNRSGSKERDNEKKSPLKSKEGNTDENKTVSPNIRRRSRSNSPVDNAENSSVGKHTPVKENKQRSNSNSPVKRNTPNRENRRRQRSNSPVKNSPRDDESIDRILGDDFDNNSDTGVDFGDDDFDDENN